MAHSEPKPWLKVGSVVSPDERDRRLINHCRTTLTMAGTLRRSGSPSDAMQLLAGSMPIQLSMLHRRYVGGHEARDTQMLESLRYAGHIEDHQFEAIREGMRSVQFGSFRDLREAMNASWVLHGLLKEIRTPEPEVPRPRFRRWLAAASTMFVVGAVK